MKLTKKSLKIYIFASVFLIAAAVTAILVVIQSNSSSETPSTSEPTPENSLPETLPDPSEENSSEIEENTENSEDKNKENSDQTPEQPLENNTSSNSNSNSNSNQTSPQPSQPTTSGGNCTTSLGKLMLINPVFTVSTSFISTRSSQLIDLTSTYGIIEGNSGNGRPRMDAEAASHLNDMIQAYKAAYPGHTIETRSCFRSRGTTCGRLCYATGTSDHHSGYTCDLLDPAYGTALNTDDYSHHLDWQWLKANSYKYGFIDRFPEEWAGGPMSQPVNINAQGSTGLFETWHYRYVGIDAATDIATGKYNNGKYDSLEHYLLARGFVNSLTTGTCK